MDAKVALGKKLVLGLVVAGLAALVGFGLLEGGLRLFGFGHSTGFFRSETDAQGRRWWRENRWVTAPYFPPQLIRRPQVIRLPEKKPAATYRIFVLGSSAAMGDPEPAFSMARQLELLLRHAYPEIHFEVVNAGITAINSHVVRALARDCAALEPDLFIVYEGNNEVIGPYGPGTVFSPFLRSSAAIRAGQLVKATRTGQLLAALAVRLRPAKNGLGDWGGMQMFLNNRIDGDDPRLATTASLFRENLLDIAASGRKAGASVFLCTVLTNEKDFAPFSSGHRAGLTKADEARWQELFEAGLSSLRAGDDASAEKSLRGALAIDDHFAELDFQLARLCLRQNRSQEARPLFQQALDWDRLRFRTDSTLNDTVRGLSGVPGVRVIDLAAAAESLSPSGVIGDDFLYEHVHLNFQGTYLMAKELFSCVSDELVKRGKIARAVPPSGLIPISQARQELGYTTYEQAMIIKELLDRFSKAPFTALSDNAERRKIYAERDAVADRILSRPETRDGLVALYEQALTANPGDWLLMRNVGMAFVALGATERGQVLLERAAKEVGDDADTLFALGLAERKLNHMAAAAKCFARVKALEPKYPGLASVEK